MIAESVAGKVTFSALVVPAVEFEIAMCKSKTSKIFLDSSLKASKFVTIPTPFVEDTTFSPKALEVLGYKAFEYHFSLYCMTIFCSAFLLNTK